MNNEIIEFDKRPPITEAEYKSKVIEMGRRLGKTYQPINDDFVLDERCGYSEQEWAYHNNEY